MGRIQRLRRRIQWISINVFSSFFPSFLPTFRYKLIHTPAALHHSLGRCLALHTFMQSLCNISFSSDSAMDPLLFTPNLSCPLVDFLLFLLVLDGGLSSLSHFRWSAPSRSQSHSFSCFRSNFYDISCATISMSIISITFLFSRSSLKL